MYIDRRCNKAGSKLQMMTVIKLLAFPYLEWPLERRREWRARPLFFLPNLNRSIADDGAAERVKVRGQISGRWR